ncbi:type VII secretion-associated protein [Nocardia terpenica]|uniref:type VII secretion-associated protein n=1 Tax=Nocardia terpenica TaxID=455432 RepID=UPI001894EDEE|nr:type VII secretion-associated protein [Nocardia terpenica]MBF6061752.1 type VII secretion-associated protein [Nocardia terpenica]MBF6107453.1 type VII secretion-associated protein [Nocardia terpenica]MBF6110172.1 type VII secretion-associated protein [Nocardia terpenica]MBF6122316.1 type VII secretion-associated protein [Nocardia terpenica]MBF6151508.1 type VII secretion-associated protein [Nocardia terpenica]
MTDHGSTAVELVLTDTRLWARGESAHWDAPPSLAPADDGTSFVVGEPLRHPAVSAVRLASADRIAFGPAAPTITEALAVVFGAALTNLRLPARCERLTVITPTDWGRRRLAAVESAARRLAAEVAVEPMAVRAMALTATAGQQQRIAVLELAPLTTTVSLIGRSGHQTWLESCEHEPTIGSADVQHDHGWPAIAAIVARLIGPRTPTYLLTVGISDPTHLEDLRTALAERCGSPIDVRPLPTPNLLHTQPSPTPPVPPRESPPSLHHAAEPTPPFRHAAESTWSFRRAFGRNPLRSRPKARRDHERATRRDDERSRGGLGESACAGRAFYRRRALLLFVAGGATVVLVGAGAGLLLWPDHGGTSGAGATSTEAVGSTAEGRTPPPVSSAPDAGRSGGPDAPQPGTTRTTAHTFGRIRAQIPLDWRIATDTATRVDIMPNDGVRQRITLVQQPLTAGSGVADVARDLDAQIGTRPVGSASPLRRDVVFGDRPGLSYEEYPGDETTVRWQILVDSGTEVSIGCQYPSGTWQSIAATCEQVVHDIRINP